MKGGAGRGEALCVLSRAVVSCVVGARNTVGLTYDDTPRVPPPGPFPEGEGGSGKA
jgi:hypothetical protein